MARRDKQRAAAGVLGKELTRRSSGRCELCASRDRPIVWEIPPFGAEPDCDRALLACTACREQLEGGPMEPIGCRHLSTAVWDERVPVRLAAARLLLRLDGPDHPQTQDVFESVGFDPVSGELVEVAWDS